MLRYTCVIALMLAASAQAQFATPPVITSTGEENVATAPAHVEYTLRFTAEKESLADSMNSVQAAMIRLEETIEEEEIGPQEIRQSAPSIPSLESTLVIGEVTLRFDVRAVTEEETPWTAFGALSDTISELSKRFNARVSGPVFDVDDKKPVERQAVKRATENALYRAEAVAELMESIIYEVENVTVDSVTWVRESEDAALRPTIDRIVCRANVTVTYRHQP